LIQVSALTVLSQSLLAQAPLQLPPTRIASYDMFDFSTLSPSSPYIVPYGISNDGKVTGVLQDPITSEDHAFIYANGVLQDLGDLGYSAGADGVAINNSAQVAATGYGPGYHALLYANGHVTHLGSLDGGFSVGLAINNLGHIVGRAINGDGQAQGFVYINGPMTAINPYVDILRSINDSDQFAGSIAFFWSQGGGMVSVEHALLDSGGTLIDLGSIGGGSHTASESFSVNNAGQVTGYSTAADGSQHAFLYSGGVLSDLGTFPPYSTRGLSINDSGVIVGDITTSFGDPLAAFLYENGEMVNFSDLIGTAAADWSELAVNQIDNQGRIIGSGTVNGATHGFLATPAKSIHTH
jgi:probable HAF family extracellular repeat protein